MASRMPRSILVLLVTAVECAVIVTAIPQYLPDHPFTYVFLRLFSLQFGALAFYKLTIYPRFVSPLRHLPHPKVKQDSVRGTVVSLGWLTSDRVVGHLLAMG